MEYVIGFLLGVAVTLVPAAVWASAQHRPAAAPAAPAQPPAPFIVMPPQPRPVTNNYTYNTYNDNRRIEVAPAQQRTTNGPPLVSAGQSLDRYHGRQNERVFKVVGEMEEW